MKSGYVDNIRLSNRELETLYEIVKVSHSAPWLRYSINGLHSSQTAKLCGVYANDSLASFAWHMQRTWIVENRSFTGLSIGLVTTIPSKRNLGYAKQLIAGIEDMAYRQNMDFLYLAGIPGFYGKFGFIGIAPKSKLVIRRDDLPKVRGSIRDLTRWDLDVVCKMYNSYSSLIASYSARSAQEWDDLIGPLSTTFLFNQPRIILNDKDSPVAYFCSTPGNSGLIREFVPLPDQVSVITALAIIASHAEYCDQGKIEVFTPSTGPVWDAAAQTIGGDFLCFLRPKSSNMIKWISKFRTMADYRCSFILQGDML